MKRNYLITILFVCVSLVGNAARNIENLDRGLVAVKTNDGVFLSWRVLGNDPSDIGFNIYRDGTKVNSSVITNCSNLTDASGSYSSNYTVKPVINGVEQAVGGTASVWSSQTLTLKLDPPTSSSCTYSPNDCSLGDVDSDGQWEIILKWDPSTSQDNSKSGKTDKVYLDCYELDGTRLWRIDLGYNIRAGAHYTQFLVGDYDGDGYAEVSCKTAPGTRDGLGKYLSKGPAANDEDTKSYRNSKGYILEGPEYLTIFKGSTGEELATVDYNPGRGTVSSWGDSYGNRVDRFLATNAYLGNNNNPSMVFCRGYYTRMAVTAYDWDGKTLSQRWYYNAPTSGQGGYGQGNHNLASGDVDGDGYDEIIHGACAIDHDGKFMYRTGAGHGDALHFGDLNPDRPGLEVYCVHEEPSSAYGYEMHDARTGEILGGMKTGTDNGRGMSADIDPNNRGYESWSGGNSNVMLSNGQDGFNRSGLSQNFRLYWDGDLQDELMDGGYQEDLTITKWNREKSVSTIFTLPGKSCNTTKRTPNLSADLIGDWREEVISHNGSNELYITTTVIPTTYKMYTLMHDPIYRNAISWQNAAYNQPPHLGFWLGGGSFPTPDIHPIGGTSAPVIVEPAVGSTHIFSTEATDAQWSDAQYWNTNKVPGSIDTAIIRKGELNVYGNINSVTCFETGGTLRVRANFSADELHFMGGTLKSYTSNPQFQMTVKTLYVEAPIVVNCGSSASSELVVNGSWVGSADATKTKTGVLTLNVDASNYSGRWILSEGIIKVTNGNGLGSNGATVASGTELIVDKECSTGSVELQEGATLTLNANLTVQTAMVGSQKLKRGVYTSVDFPDLIKGNAQLIVTKGEESTSVLGVSSETASIRLYPNPTNDDATLILSSEQRGSALVQIMRVDGTVVFESYEDLQVGENHIRLEMDDQPKGIYLVRAVVAGRATLLKLVVE